MRKLVAIIAILLLAATANAQLTGALAPAPKEEAPSRSIGLDPIDPGAFSASLQTLVTVEPLKLSGDWSEVVVAAGIGYSIPQSSKPLEAWFTPDRATVFLGQNRSAGGSYKLGASLDWNVGIPYVSFFVGALKNTGQGAGLKLDLLNMAF